MSLCLCLPLSAVVYQQLPAHFTINNDILMRMSPDQADRIFLVYRKLKLCDAVRSINYGLWYLTSLSTIF